MKNSKRLLLMLPEILLIAAVIFYWIYSGMRFNPVAIVLLIILIIQIILRNKILGLIIPGFFIVAGLYMLMALKSEVSEFPVFNAEAGKLMGVGLIYFISVIFISGLMIYKYSVQDNINKKHA